MFGHAGARIGKKFFAMEYDEDVVVKLGPERVEALVAGGRARQFEPMAGRPMNGWAQVPPGDGDPVPFWPSWPTRPRPSSASSRARTATAPVRVVGTAGLAENDDMDIEIGHTPGVRRFRE